MGFGVEFECKVAQFLKEALLVKVEQLRFVVELQRNVAEFGKAAFLIKTRLLGFEVEPE